MRNSSARARLCALMALSLAACGGAEESSVPPDSPLLAPQSAAMTATAPETFQARFETSEGAFVIEVHRDWSPNGADRLYSLVSNGFYAEVRFFRVITGFMAQFGIHGDPGVSAAWRGASIADDPVVASNTRGMVSFAMTGQPNSRTTQLFINLADNQNLDGMGFAPVGEVVDGMNVVDRLYAGYGEGAPSGPGPSQPQLQSEGNRYLDSRYPELDYIVSATIVP